MSSFVRRFTFDPGNDVLLNIESVNVLDLDPPASLRGVGTGTVLVVGEFENGPYNYVLEVGGSDDLQRQFGTLGYTYAGVQANNPCAIARKADGASSAEFWNGNAFVQLNGKQFARLIICRVNTSVGAVQLTKLAFVQGTSAALVYSLTAGAVLSLDVGAGPQSATFSATAAQVTGSAAAFGSIAAGNQVTLGYDAAPNFTVTFQAGDTTIANVVARINQFAGFAIASNSGGQLRLTGLQQGNTAQVRVVSDNTSGTTITNLGLAVGTTLGTGNVANIASVKQSEVQAIVQAAVANTRVEWDSQSRIRVSNSLGSLLTPYIQVTPASTASLLLAFGLTSGQIGTQQGQAVVVSGALTLTLLTNDTVTLGVDAQPNVTVTFQNTDNTAALIATRINTAFASVGLPSIATADGAGNIFLQSVLQGTTAAQVRVIGASSGAVLTKLGLAVGTYLGVAGPVGVLPAGTVVQVPGSSGPVFVLAQDVNFSTQGVIVGGVSKAAGGTNVPSAGPFTVPIRHALDDGSGLAASAGAITQITTVPDVYSFNVTNLVPTTAALTEGQIDAAYATALTGPTMDINTVAKQTNIIFSARQSSTVRAALRTNAVTASGTGCFGRVACVRPPLNTDKLTAQSQASPGVGATRDQRVIYCYIGSNTFVPLIARRGSAGNPSGTGYTAFTADGNVDVGSDSMMASILSQLPPEEDPGQDTPFTTVVNGVEQGANVQGFQMNDYIAFKAAGIAALRVDDGVVSFQTGCTSVDPNVYPQLADINRRRMADYIQDSLAARGKAYGKKLSTFARRKAFANEIRQFLEGLLSANNPQFQRINGFTLDPVRGNTQQSLQSGIYRVRISVQTLTSLKSIVLEATIGAQVQVVETLPLAA